MRSMATSKIPDIIALHLDPDETKPHAPLPPRRPPPPEPAIFAIMARVGMWLAWLTASFGAYSELIGHRWQWNPYVLVMMVIVGYMAATRKDSAVLETAIVVLGGVWAVLMFK